MKRLSDYLTIVKCLYQQASCQGFSEAAGWLGKSLEDVRRIFDEKGIPAESVIQARENLWARADLALALKKMHSRAEISLALGISGRCLDYLLKTARVFPPEKRPQDVSCTICQALASFDDPYRALELYRAGRSKGLKWDTLKPCLFNCSGESGQKSVRVLEQKLKQILLADSLKTDEPETAVQAAQPEDVIEQAAPIDLEWLRNLLQENQQLKQRVENLEKLAFFYLQQLAAVTGRRLRR